MILPESAHVAWEKGAEYFDVKPIRIPLGEDYKVNTELVKKAVNRRTVMILGSAPGYPHGAIDDIETLGEIASSRQVPLHIDACVGGYLLPFVTELGYDIPPFDFRVPGVTSISADTHKYGFSAKGASTILYRDMDHMAPPVLCLHGMARRGLCLPGPFRHPPRRGRGRSLGRPHGHGTPRISGACKSDHGGHGHPDPRHPCHTGP